jgi:hypothetical protein
MLVKKEHKLKKVDYKNLVILEANGAVSYSVIESVDDYS